MSYGSRPCPSIALKPPCYTPCRSPYVRFLGPQLVKDDLLPDQKDQIRTAAIPIVGFCYLASDSARIHQTSLGCIWIALRVESRQIIATDFAKRSLTACTRLACFGLLKAGLPWHSATA